MSFLLFLQYFTALYFHRGANSDLKFIASFYRPIVNDAERSPWINRYVVAGQPATVNNKCTAMLHDKNSSSQERDITLDG